MPKSIETTSYLYKFLVDFMSPFMNFPLKSHFIVYFMWNSSFFSLIVRKWTIDLEFFGPNFEIKSIRSILLLTLLMLPVLRVLHMHIFTVFLCRCLQSQSWLLLQKCLHSHQPVCWSSGAPPKVVALLPEDESQSIGSTWWLSRATTPTLPPLLLRWDTCASYRAGQL